MNLLSKSWITGAALFIAGSNMMNAQDVESLLQGDVLKVLAYKTSFKGLVEGVAIYVSHSTPAE